MRFEEVADRQSAEYEQVDMEAKCYKCKSADVQPSFYKWAWWS